MEDDLISSEESQLQVIALEYDCSMEKVTLDQMLKMTPRQLEGTARIQEARAYLAMRAEAIRDAVFLHNAYMKRMKP